MSDNLKKWLELYDSDILFKTLSYLTDVEDNGYSLQPGINNVFRAFELCPYNDLKVVIMGQDPYPQPDVATGLAFANKRGVRNISPSLEILKNSVISPRSDMTGKIFDETLESWAEQGVLMLNGALTTLTNRPGSQLDVWRTCTESLLHNLSHNYSGIIYVLLGPHAKSFESVIRPNSNTIIKDNHPTYYVRKNMSYEYNFFNSVNVLLEYNFNEEIKWYKNV